MDPNVDLDAVAADKRFLPCRGWHNDQIEGQDYLPVIQQVRAEFVAFAVMLADMKISDKCLQIGLGMTGGAHLAFALMFREAWTIERDANNLDRFLARVPGDHNLIFGDSRQDETLGRSRQLAPFDLLFIDGDHGYREVASDYLRYKPLVKSGGIVAFHDAVCNDYEVSAFLNDLHSNGVEINIIGTSLGIAWTVA